MVYSNRGDYLSAGLCTGEVGTFESDSGRLLTIGRPLSQSQVTTRISVYLYKSCFDIIYTVVNISCEDTSDSGYVPYDS